MAHGCRHVARRVVLYLHALDMAGWWPSLAMAHLGQFLGVWLAVLGPGLANQSQPYAWSLARIERPNRLFDPSQVRASSWLSFRHRC